MRRGEFPAGRGWLERWDQEQGDVFDDRQFRFLIVGDQAVDGDYVADLRQRGQPLDFRLGGSAVFCQQVDGVYAVPAIFGEAMECLYRFAPRVLQVHRVEIEAYLQCDDSADGPKREGRQNDDPTGTVAGEARFQFTRRRLREELQQRRQQGHVQEEGNQHAARRDYPEFREAFVIRRQEREEAECGAQGTDGERTADIGSGDLQRIRRLRRLAERIAITQAKVNAEIDAEPDEQDGEGDGDQVQIADGKGRKRRGPD